MLFLLLVAHTIASTYGIDFQNNITQSQMTCLYQEQKKAFVILRAYRSYGVLDNVINENLKKAHNAGFKYIDIYMFPCFECGNPEKQVDTMIDGVTEKYGMVWMDIEIWHWGTNLTANREFITKLISQLKKRKASIGIYTSKHNWQNIVGLDWTELKEYPLWYAHYDNNPTFSDFVSFGGWAKPAIKQYSPDVQNYMCGFGVDQDVY